MPSLISTDVYESCGRLSAFGSSMFQMKDRANRPMCLGPTHEELFAYLAKNRVKSYIINLKVIKEITSNLWKISQFQTAK